MSSTVPKAKRTAATASPVTISQKETRHSVGIGIARTAAEPPDLIVSMLRTCRTKLKFGSGSRMLPNAIKAHKSVSPPLMMILTSRSISIVFAPSLLAQIAH